MTCKCTVAHGQVTIKDWLPVHDILYCPMHSSAPAMLKALKEIASCTVPVPNPKRSPRDLLYCASTVDAMKIIAKEAIKAAEES